MPWQAARIGLALAALVVALVAQFRSGPGSTPDGVGLAFAIAAVLFVGAIWGRREVGSAPEDAPAWPALPLRVEAGLLLAVMALAAFFRFWHFLSFPPGLWYDEGVNGTDAIYIMNQDHLTVWRPTNFGHSTIFFYLLIASFKLFGFTVFAMRLVPALAGLAAVLAFYFLARRLLGPIPALVATAFFAISRYAVTFSRISWEASLMPLLEIMGVYFFITGLEKRSWWRMALAGGSVAAGMYTYLAFRFVPFIVIALFLYVAWREWPLIRRNIPRLVLGLVASVVVFAPLGQFALRHQDEFLHRTRDINVFKEIDRKGSWEPLRHNIRAGLKMMNLAGDRNGRHNLPGAPMLDDVSAALLVLGAATSIWAWRRWRAGFALPWLVLTLVPGALTIEIENPSAIRGIGSLAPLFLLVGLAVAGVYRVASFDRRVLAAAGVAVVALLGLSAWLNFHELYDKQAHNQDVFESFQPIYTKIGQEIHDHGNSYRVIVSDQYLGHPAVLTLGNNIPRQQLTPNTMLPLPVTQPEQDVLLLFDPQQQALVDAYRQFYPNARYDDVRDQFGRPFYSRLWVSQDDVASVRNLDATYSGIAPGGSGQATRLELPVHDWPQDIPDGISGPFQVEWSGSLQVRTAGSYDFQFSSPGAVHLELDGQPALDGTDQATASIKLTAGLHSLRARAAVATATGRTALRWRVPGKPDFQDVGADAAVSLDPGTTGLTATYYKGTEWQGDPQSQARQLFPGPETYYPAAYSVELDSALVLDQAGNYQFQVNAASPVLLFVDDTLVVDAGGSHPMISRTGAQYLDSGPHRISIRYYNPSGWPSWSLDWKPPAATDWQRMTNDLFHLPTTVPQPPHVSVNVAIDATWGRFGRSLSGVAQPRSIAFDAQGRMLLADPGSGRISMFDSQGNPVGTIDTALKQINDIAVAPDGRIAVLDTGEHHLAVFEPDGQVVADRLDLSVPAGLAWGPDGRLWVAEITGSQIAAIRADGGIQRYPLSFSGSPVRQPVSVAVSRAGLVYILNIEDPRVWVFDPNQGSVTAAWSAPGGFGSAPPRLVLNQEFVLVTDTEGARLVVYDNQGRLRGSLQFPVQDPTVPRRPGGMAFAPDGSLWVTDPGAGVVFKLTFTVQRPPGSG